MGCDSNSRKGCLSHSPQRPTEVTEKDATGRNTEGSNQNTLSQNSTVFVFASSFLVYVVVVVVVVLLLLVVLFFFGQDLSYV